MRAGFGCYLNTAFFCASDNLHPAVRRHMADVNGNVKTFRKSYVAGNHNVFRGTQTAFKPRKRGIAAFVYDSAVHKVYIFAVTEAL